MRWIIHKSQQPFYRVAAVIFNLLLMTQQAAAQYPADKIYVRRVMNADQTSAAADSPPWTGLVILLILLGLTIFYLVANRKKEDHKKDQSL
ncbi:MAG: hypothetical protein ACLFPX_06090 [Candidatus Omnitrophota bacterium]